MKKLLLILLAAIFIAGCSDNGDDVTSDSSKDKETSETVADNKDGDKKIFQIGETADITTVNADLPYQVTVNSFELTTDSVDGVKLEDYNYSVEDGHQFGVVNVTMKNTGDVSFVPMDHISAEIYDGEIPQFLSKDETFKERFEELEPGKEITGNLVYGSTYFDDFEVLHLVFEAESFHNETRFELPMP
jgi:hypothetical protein